LQTSDFEFPLPPDRVAAAPADARDDARLMVMDRGRGERKHLRFRDILAELPPRSLLVLNDARVLAARLRGRKPTGGAVEFLLTRRVSEIAPAEPGPRGGQNEKFCELWEGLARGLGGAAGPAATAIEVGGGVCVDVVERRDAGRALLRLSGPGASLLAVLDGIGELPLPPYIEAARKRLGDAAPRVDDRARYQTVYAASVGAVAAPTAGLHFTPALLDAIAGAGHEIATLTLDVGPGTFRPVEVDDPRAHHLDAERYRISPEAAAAIAGARRAGRPVVAVGTTAVRSLEAAARAGGGEIVAGDAETDLCLLPGDSFQVVTDLITNFHLPRSTLLMLVAAFAGTANVLDAYREAVERGYRFYSYGDAMLIRSGRTGEEPASSARRASRVSEGE
jgi:S-adenosylmethionine:tRNA ribosyltransferase-isomerase